MFNGVTLLIAIGIAGYAQRRRGASSRKPIGAPPSVPVTLVQPE